MPEVRNDKEFLDLHGLERFWNNVKDYLDMDAYTVPAGKQVASVRQDHGRVVVTFEEFGGATGAAKEAARESLGVSSSEEVDEALAGKADLADGAVEGNLAALDADGNLVDSGVDPETLKRVQEAWSDEPDSALYTLGSIGQDANGVVSVTFVRIPDATVSSSGLMSSEDKGKLDGLPDAAGLDGLLAGKADKEVPSAAGNVATLDAEGNLADSGYGIVDDVADPVTHAIDYGTFRENIPTGQAVEQVIDDKVTGGISDLNFADRIDFATSPKFITTLSQTAGQMYYEVSAMDDTPQTHSNAPVTSQGIHLKFHDIETLIPSAASSDNQLADKEYVDSLGERIEARYLGSDVSGNPFASYADFEDAQLNDGFYYNGTQVQPNNNDVVVITSDETHLYPPGDEHGTPSTTRYHYQGESDNGQWCFEYVINNSALNRDQLLAVNSGITPTKVQNYDAHLVDQNNPHHVTKGQVGLGNVNNTADLDKPISTATQTALDGKADKVQNGNSGHLVKLDTDGVTLIDSGAAITSYYNASDTANPVTGSGVAQAIGELDNSDEAVTHEFVTAAVQEDGLVTVSRARPVINDVDGLSDTLTEITGDIGDIVVGKADKDEDAVVGNIAEFDENGNPVDSGHALSEYKTKQGAIAVNPESSTNSLTFLTSFEQNANGEITNASAATVPDASTSLKGVVQLTDSTSTTSSTLAATATAVKEAYDHAGSLVESLDSTKTGTSTNVDVQVVEEDGLITSVSVTDRTPTAIANAIEALDATVRTDDSETGTAPSRNIDLTITQDDGVLTGITVNRDDSVNAGDLASAISTAVGNMDATVRTDSSETGTADNRNIDLTVTQVDGVLTGITVNRDETENRNNKVSSFQSTPDDAHYPSEKLVKNSLDLKANKSEMTVTPGSGADTDKTTIQLKNGTAATVLVSHQDITGKADKVSGATDGNFAGLDSHGNLVDSGSKASDFKTIQSEVLDPSADGTGITFIDSITQNANGVISPHKKTVQSATSSQPGVMSAADKTKLDALPSNAELENLLAAKADKDTDADEGNLASFDSNGNPVDSGASITSTYDAENSTDPVTGAAVSSAIADKADKVASAVNGNFAGLDANGNLTDSGRKASDFATAGHGHGNITNDGKIGTTADLSVVTTTDGEVTTADLTTADVSAAGTTLTAVTKVTQDSKGKISVEKKTIQDGTTSQKGVVQLSSTAGSDEDKAATPKLVSDSVSGKADKVSGATTGNFAGLDSEGNLTDSGKKASDFAAVGHIHGNITNDGKIGSISGLGVVTGTSGIIETKDFSTSSPETGVGTTTEFIDTVSQGTDGKITATKKAITHASTSTAGIVSLSSDTTSTSETEAATSLAVKTVKDAVDGLGNNKADKVSNATNGNFAGLDASGNLTDSGKKASDFATSAQGTKADSAIQGVKVDGSVLTPDANKVVSIPDASTSAKGTVQLSSATDSTSETEAATPKAVKLAYDRAGDLLAGLDNTETSTDGTNVQVKVTQVDGAITAVNVTTDNTENRGNKVTSWSSTTTDAHYPSEKLVKGSLDEKANKSEMSVTPGTGADSDKTTITLKTGTSATVLTTHQDISGKADKVSGATSGNFAGLDTNGNITDSGSKAADFATASQGDKADTAVQDVKIGNTSLVTDNVASLPDATTLVKGVVQLTDSHTSTSTTTAATPKNVKEAYDLAVGKAAKVSGATSGNLASLDSSGDLVDSGIAATNVKTKQSAVNDPDASGITITAIDTISQNANGEITATKKTIRSGTTSQTGIVQLSDAVNSTSTSLAATANAVKKAYDHADSLVNSLDVSSVGGAGKYISAISETDGKISATETTMDTTPTENSTNAITSGAVFNAVSDINERISGMGFEIVPLTTGANPHPDVASPSTSKIYLTKESSSSETDPYTEWIYTSSLTWEIIGETSMDLSGYKTVQAAVSDPTASGTTLTAIDTISQNANGEITVTKKTIQDGTTSQKGVVQLTDSHTSTSTTTAATPKSVKDAYDLAAGKAAKVSGATEGNFAALDANGDLTDSGKKASDFKTVQSDVSDPTASGNALSFIDTISQNTNGVITATKKSVPVDSTYSSSGTNPVNGTAVAAAIGTLDVSDITGFGAGKTLATLTETDGKIAATFQDIEITKSQVSDFSHSHGNITSDGKIGTTANLPVVTGASGVVTTGAFATSTVAVGTSSSAGSANTFSRGDHVHSISLATGDSDGQVKIAGSNVSVAGWANKADKKVPATAGNLATLDANGNLADSGVSYAGLQGEFKLKQTAVTVSGLETAKTITAMSQDADGVISVTASDIRPATTGQTGIVRLNNTVTSTSTTQAATANAVKTAYDHADSVVAGLDAEITSTDGTNVQVKVTETDGKITAVNVTTDNTENKNNKVTEWSATTTDTHYPSEKLVKDSLDAKVTGPSSATSGDIAVFDGTTGKLVKDGGKKISDIALNNAVVNYSDAIVKGTSNGGYWFKIAERTFNNVGSSLNAAWLATISGTTTGLGTVETFVETQTKSNSTSGNDIVIVKVASSPVSGSLADISAFKNNIFRIVVNGTSGNATVELWYKPSTNNVNIKIQEIMGGVSQPTTTNKNWTYTSHSGNTTGTTTAPTGTSYKDITWCFAKELQSEVSSPSASGTALEFIDTISQNANGEITATKKTVAYDSTPTAGSTNLVTSGGVQAAITGAEYITNANAGIPPFDTSLETGGSVKEYVISSNGSNIPAGNYNWHIHATSIKYAANSYRVTQIATGSNSTSPSIMYERSAISSNYTSWTWGEWKRYLNTDDITSSYSATGTKVVNGTAVAAAIGTLDVSNISGFGAGKTLATLTEADGKIAATFQDIEITKSQVSDFPTEMTPSSHTHGNITSAGALQTTDVTIASGDKLVITDSSDSNKVARSSTSFDGSTTTTALTPKGTFEAFAKAADITTAIQALDVGSVGGAGKYISAISETDGKISATATDMDTTPTASSTNAVTSGGVKTALDAKVNIANISLENQSTTLLSIVQSYAGTANKHYARWYTKSDGGTKLTDLPVSGKCFVCEAICSRWVGASDYVYQLTLWSKEDTNPYVAIVKQSTTSISWSRLNTNTHYTTHLFAGISGAAENAETTNGNTALIVADNTSARDNIIVQGTGGTTVTSDANGVISIDSPATGFTTSGTNYAVQTDANNQMYVAVPWTDNDTKVKQTADTTNDAAYPLLAKYTTATSTVTDESRFTSGVTLNPKNKTLTATKFIGALQGNADTATKPKTTTLTTSNSLDDIKGSSLGDVLYYSWTSGNAPTGATLITGSGDAPTATMEVVRTHSGNYCIQTVYTASKGVYQRIYNNDTWGSWYSYAKSSHVHGQINNNGTITSNGVDLASGDRLAIVDSSDSSLVKKTNIAFDGSTVSKALTQKGTFESVMMEDDAMPLSAGDGIALTYSSSTATISSNFIAGAGVNISYDTTHVGTLSLSLNAIPVSTIAALS